MTGLNRLGIDQRTIDTVVISHLHGDHFAGLVWMMLHGQHVARRTEPLAVYGPSGIEARFTAAAEALFPGSTKVPQRFPTTWREMTARQPIESGDAVLEGFEVVHPSGAPSHAVRLAMDGRVIAYSGDTEWTDALVDCADRADLFIVECFARDMGARYHLDWPTLEAALPRLSARRILITHMGTTMLDRPPEVSDPRVTMAHDGLVFNIDAA
jgi:ribonuclease BN (tRNA processing enzyme)